MLKKNEHRLLTPAFAARCKCGADAQVVLRTFSDSLRADRYVVTPEQVAMVRSSFAELGPRVGQLAARFYEGLFATEPSLRSMFSHDPSTQERLFVAEVGVIVSSISRFDAFVVRTRELGARHAAYGVMYVHYEIAGRVLLDALADTFGSAFTDELNEAWRLAFDLVAETMMQGGADASW